MSSISSNINFGDGNSGLALGINNGTVNFLPRPMVRVETPPPPLSTVPFQRDLDFVDHGTSLSRIQEKGLVPGARAAIVGLGGVGKSQIAIEYCYRVRERSPQTWVFWLHASNAARLEQSCREAADRAKIPGRSDPETNIFQLFNSWLNDAKTGEWVLIFDNLDDDHFLHAASSTQGRSIWSHFSQSLSGTIIITSRSKRAVLKLVEDRDIIQVKPMDQSSAISLFGKKLGTEMESNREDVNQLVKALEFMPLALVQAAAYIKRRAPRQSVGQYLASFQNNDRQKISLLHYEEGHLRRDQEAKNSILTAWHISFDHIREQRPSAGKLLSLMSFFDRQGIPEGLLRVHTEINFHTINEDIDDNEGYSDQSPVDDMFENDITMLRDYSMISISADCDNFEMHRLVQLATQEWLKTQKDFEQFHEQFIKVLCDSFPRGCFEDWPICEPLFAHVLRAAAHEPNTESSTKSLSEKWAKLLYNGSMFARNRGYFNDSQRLAESYIAVMINLQGPSGLKTLRGSSLLGTILSSKGQLKKAKKIHMQGLEARKTTLGPDHPRTLSSMNNLATIYGKLGGWSKAEDLQVQVLKARNIMFGLENLDTLASMRLLASTYQDQGRWRESEDLNLEALDISKRVLGPAHPDTLLLINAITSVYWNQDRWKEGEELVLQALEASKLVLGSKHVTFAMFHNLAMIYFKQGRWKEAEDLILKVLETSKRVLGPAHPVTLIIINSQARVYSEQGRFKDATDLHLQVLEARKHALGPKNSVTLDSMNSSAHGLRQSGEEKAAFQLMADCVQLRNRILGPNHPDTMDSTTTLNDWRELDVSASSQFKETSAETNRSEVQSMATQSSEQGSLVGKGRGRALFTHLFRSRLRNIPVMADVRTMYVAGPENEVGPLGLKMGESIWPQPCYWDP
ncbi:P-loop containing nucleoside triphosphate hydrolase protein [Penicillium angulare]|uniref:P-loop containing nucleoside triphosphate hydrolase protein n=1 Tax=Penicillium angulare TaxID=116970 RepID=A0A9W9F339_9EURO|nr:P-loop containing nucleoside triphosphate hydrolase protein [Penicillium angulare]